MQSIYLIEIYAHETCKVLVSDKEEWNNNDLLIISINFSDITILNINGSDYCCSISLISKNGTINLMQISDLIEKSGEL